MADSSRFASGFVSSTRWSFAALLLGLAPAVVHAQGRPTSFDLNVSYSCSQNRFLMVVPRCDGPGERDLCDVELRNPKAPQQPARRSKLMRTAILEFLRRCEGPGLPPPVTPAGAAPASKSVPVTPPASGPPPGSPAARAPASAPGAAPPRTPGRPDPSVAKARAAHVDLTVFGIPLGEPLNIPECTRTAQGAAASLLGLGLKQSCQTKGDVVGLVMGALGAQGFDALIKLPPDKCPGWVSLCGVYATVKDGLLLGVSIPTAGEKAEEAVTKQLRSKYGNPTRPGEGKFLDDGGATSTGQDLDWALPGLHVQYRPDAGTGGGGALVIETETGQKLRESAGQQGEAKEPKL